MIHKKRADLFVPEHPVVEALERTGCVGAFAWRRCRKWEKRCVSWRKVVRK